MKKLLVLSLVLAIGAISSAALSISYEDGKILLTSSEALIGGIDVNLGIVGAGSWGDLDFLRPGRPAVDPSVTKWGDTTGMDLPWNDLVQVAWAEAVVDPFPAGDWLIAPINASSPVEVQLVDGNFKVLQTLSVVPEPMTMGLLGLGALFLRRRK